MATVFLIDWANAHKSEKSERDSRILINRWGERLYGGAFVSLDESFILTDFHYEHKEVQLLVHILNCDNVPFRCITNIGLEEMGESLWKSALTGSFKKTNNNINNKKKGA